MLGQSGYSRAISANVGEIERRLRSVERRLERAGSRATAAVSLGKHKSLETLVERADRSVEQARSARAEREAPPARSEPLT